MYKCSKCKKELEEGDTYEFRGAFSCWEHFEEVQESREFERQEIIREENHKTRPFRGLNMTATGKLGDAQREIMKPFMEIARKESGRIKAYENR